jgi:hypothetical protein
MKASVRLLSWSLFAATIATGAFGATNENPMTGSKPGNRVPQESPVMLAGADGHDTVGGLMPLPLWPPNTLHAQEVVPARAWKRKPRPCCGTMHHRSNPRGSIP